jgi:hypothetical protein
MSDRREYSRFSGGITRLRPQRMHSFCECAATGCAMRGNTHAALIQNTDIAI